MNLETGVKWGGSMEKLHWFDRKTLKPFFSANRTYFTYLYTFLVERYPIYTRVYFSVKMIPILYGIPYSSRTSIHTLIMKVTIQCVKHKFNVWFSPFLYCWLTAFTTPNLICTKICPCQYRIGKSLYLPMYKNLIFHSVARHSVAMLRNVSTQHSNMTSFYENM